MSAINCVRFLLIMIMVFSTLCTAVGVACGVNMDSWIVATLVTVAIALANEGLYALASRKHEEREEVQAPQIRAFPRDCDSCEHLHITTDKFGDRCWSCDKIPDVIVASGAQNAPRWCECPEESEDHTC